MKNLFLIMCVAIFIQGCATTYQCCGLTGGYSEIQLNENVFKVSFKGNGFTGQERAIEFALLRCAELTLEYGYKYFVSIDADSYISNSAYTTPTTYYGNVYSYGNSAYGTVTTTGGQTYNISKPSASITIVCFKKKPNTKYSFIYDAEFVYNGISQKYGIKQTPK